MTLICPPFHPAIVPLKKNKCRFFPDSCRSKAVLQRDSSPVAPVPSAKIDRSTILVMKNGTRCCRNGCPTGCNGKSVANPLQLSKFSLKLSKLMNPLHFQQRPATAEKTGQQRVPHQYSTGFQRVPIENPLNAEMAPVANPLFQPLLAVVENAMGSLICLI